MSKKECKKCSRAEFWTDQYWGKVGECEGKPRIRIRPEDKCKRQMTQVKERIGG